MPDDRPRVQLVDHTTHPEGMPEAVLALIHSVGLQPSQVAWVRLSPGRVVMSTWTREPRGVLRRVNHVYPLTDLPDA